MFRCVLYGTKILVYTTSFVEVLDARTKKATPIPENTNQICSVTDDGRLLLLFVEKDMMEGGSEYKRKVKPGLWCMDTETGKLTLISTDANGGVFLHGTTPGY